MGFFPKPAGPKAVFADLRAFFARPSREQTIAGALAFLVTSIIVIVFFVDPTINTAPPAEVIYVEIYGPERTDAQIVADQQQRKAARDAAILARQKEFQKLEKQLGIE